MTQCDMCVQAGRQQPHQCSARPGPPHPHAPHQSPRWWRGQHLQPSAIAQQHKSKHTPSDMCHNTHAHSSTHAPLIPHPTIKCSAVLQTRPVRSTERPQRRTSAAKGSWSKDQLHAAIDCMVLEVHGHAGGTHQGPPGRRLRWWVCPRPVTPHCSQPPQTPHWTMHAPAPPPDPLRARHDMCTACVSRHLRRGTAEQATISQKPGGALP